MVMLVMLLCFVTSLTTAFAMTTARTDHLPASSMASSSHHQNGSDARTNLTREFSDKLILKETMSATDIYEEQQNHNDEHHLIHNTSHWSNSTKEVEATIKTMHHLIIMYYLIGALGVLGNLFVLIVMFSNRTLRTKLTNIFIINQTLVDFAISLFLMILSDVQSTAPSGLLGDLYCKIWATKLFLWGFLVSSTYNLVCLTMERYLAVVRPIWHKVSFTKNKATAMLVFIWLFGPAWNASYMIVTSANIDGTCAIYALWPSLTVRRFFGVFTVILQFLLPLAFIVYAYGAIASTLYSKLKNGGAAKGKDETIQRGMRNTIKTLVLVAICFVACWSWNQIYYLMMNLGYREDYSSDFYHFTVIAVFLNSCVNPIIYSLKYEPFKRAAYKLFCTKLLGVKPNTVIDESTANNTTRENIE